MQKYFCWIVVLLIVISCKTVVKESVYTISGEITNGNGKYLKIIDMTIPGFKPDSIMIDPLGKLTFKQKSKEPKDLVIYIEKGQYIRLLPCPGEVVSFKTTLNSFVDSLTISGSPESERLSILLKQHYRANYILDTLNKFYMANQLNANIADIVLKIRAISDSVQRQDRLLHEQFINSNPGALSSYVALSSKLGIRTNLFNISTDLSIFENVDTSLRNKYDTITISKMLSSYVKKGKLLSRQIKLPAKGTLPGDTAPEIALPNPYGDTIKLSSLKGKYILINFWGSWCKPCRDENLILRDVYLAYRYKGFDIFSVALERTLTDWKNTIREDKLIWKNHVSELNYMNSKIARLYQVEAIPSNYLIGPDGVVIAVNLDLKQLNQKLSELIVMQSNTPKTIIP